MERFEIRLYDNIGFTSIINLPMTFEQAQSTLDNTYAGMLKMGVDSGSIQLRGEDDKLVQAYLFTAAKERAAKKRQQARVRALREAMYAQGFDENDLNG